jgi:TolB-like protein/Tfp pilus assembly protein PilF
MKELKTTIYEFGPFRLDAAERRLYSNGQIVQLTSKLFDLLLLLVENSGHLITKDYIMNAVWPNSFVEENNVTVSISALRKALGTGVKGRSYIETVSGRGYRFTARVRVAISPEDKQDKRPEVQHQSACKSVAVFPFETVGVGAGHGHLETGIIDLLITKLVRTEQVIVLPVSSLYQSALAERNFKTIGRDLGANYILTGKIKQAGDCLRLVIQLMETHDGKCVWAEQLDEKNSDEFEVENLISDKLIGTLVQKLIVEDHDQLIKRYSENEEAFEAVLRGQYFLTRRTIHGFNKALEQFQLAIEIDSNFALAYVGLANCYNLLNSYGVIPSVEATTRAKEALRRAIEIDAHLAEAYAAQGYIKMIYDWDWSGAEKDFQYAINSNPNYAMAQYWYSNYLRAVGRFDEAMAATRRAQILDPYALIIKTGLALQFYLIRQYDSVIRQCRGILDLEPDFSIPVILLASAYAETERYEEALGELQEALKIDPDDPEILSLIGYTYAKSGDREGVQRMLDRVEEVSKRRYVNPSDVVLIYAGLGDVDQTFTLLERAYEARSQYLIWFKTDPRLDSIRQDSRYTDLLWRIGFREGVDDDNNNERVNSLAVLPLENSRADQNLEYFSDGVTESIINILSHLPHLKVMARSTVFRYKGEEVDVREVGRTLGVRAVLTGRVMQVGESIVLNFELVDVIDGSQIWGEQFTHRLSDILTVQEEVARTVTERLQLKLTGEETKLLAKRYTKNTSAYQKYLKGRYFWNKYSEETLRKSIEYFQQAIRIDSDYALAYAGLSDAYFRLSNLYLSPTEALPKARAAALKAVEIDPHLAEAHASLGIVKVYYEHDWSGAEAEYRRAIGINPGSALAHQRYGMYLMMMCRFDEAIIKLKLAQELDPLSLQTGVVLANCWNLMGNHERALEQLRNTLELDPDYHPAHVALGWVYIRMGKIREAIAELKHSFQLQENNLALGLLGYAYAISGQKKEAGGILKELKNRSLRKYVSPYKMAIIYAGLGEIEDAFKWLDKLFDDHSEWLVMLKVVPELDSLRSTPRFIKLLKRVGFSD